jgi:hypothetical protein
MHLSKANKESSNFWDKPNYYPEQAGAVSQKRGGKEWGALFG